MAQIQNLNESWDGIHTGDEIEAFLKSELRKANDKVGGIKVNGIMQDPDQEHVVEIEVPEVDDELNEESNNVPKTAVVAAEINTIKHELQRTGEKYGEAIVTTDDNGAVTIRFFENAENGELWQTDPDANAGLVMKVLTFQGGTELQDYSMVARVVTPLQTVQIANEDNIFTFNYNSYWGSDPTDLDSNLGTAVLYVNNIEMESISLVSGGNNYSLNAGQYISQETNNVRIVVSNAHGKSRTWNYTVEAKSLGISFTESYLNQQTIAKTPGWLLPIQVSGVGGMVYVSIDDDELRYQHYVAGGSQYSFAIDSNGSLERGTHSIKVWCEDALYGLQTGVIESSYIVQSQSIGVAIGANPPKSVTMYDTAQIPYYFYSPADDEGEVVDVTIEIVDENSTVISTAHQSVEVDANHSSGLRNAVVQIMDNTYINTNMTVRISVGQGAGIVSATHVVAIGAAEVTLREASECKVHYNMAGKTNSDADVVANSMSSSYSGVQTSQLVRSENFALKNDNGFLGGGFLIPTQRSVTLTGWQPFSADIGANGNHEGKTIEMEFSIGTAVDMDRPVISCMDGRCGFNIYPTRIEVKYSGSDSVITTYFPDGERIKFSLVINGVSTNCVNDDGNGNVESNSRNLGFIYVNGVMVRIFDYAASTWQQQTVKNIVFGSDECELTVYSIRGYDKALSMREILDNFSYDTPLLTDKISIAKRNNILLSDGVTVDKNLVETALPNTPIIDWWIERLPANKKDPRECKRTIFTNPEWEESLGHACAPFTAGSHEINGDGTSSNAYPLPYKNWAEKYKDFNGGSQGIITLHLTSGDTTVKKYSITYGIDDKETKFVHKVNFASSEGIFNILAMNMYQQITLNSYRGINDLLSLQQQAQVDAGNDITFRKSLSGFPEIGFRTYTENDQLVTKFISIYNFINNKKTGSMFGMVDDYKVNQLWEVDENVNFFNTPMTEHSVDGSDNVIESNGVRDSSPFYYARFPDASPVNDGNDLGMVTKASDVAQANDEIRALRKVHNWIVSINPNVANRYYAMNGVFRPFTIAEDGFESKTYAGTTYTRDTPAYRAQKFLAECDTYLHVNDCIFYFLFCTYIIGMDSMDKNMSLFFDTVEDFYSDDPAVREAATVRLRIMLRDTDTGELFNNSGVLTYRYWHEWNDTYNTETGETGQITGETYNQETQSFAITTNVPGSSPVFNGRMSGLWDAISTYLPGQIKTIYQTMRQAGLNYNTFMAMFERFHNYWCEALYNVDGLGYANTGNFTMAYGDKMMVSKYFFKYRERYMDSKYGYAMDAHQVTLRLSSVPNGIWMKHFTPIYASFSYGGNVPTVVRSIEVGEPALLPCTANTFNDATCYINDADLVTEIGTYVVSAGGVPVLNGWEGMQNFHFTFNFGRLVRLQKFIWANTSERPNTEQTVSNGSIEFNNLKMLKELVMTYCTGWTGSPVIGSDIIEKIDFRGTPIVNITLPETDTLTELRLPSTLKNLSLRNLPNIETFSIADVPVLESLEVIDSSVDGMAIVAMAYNRYISENETFLLDVNINNINMEINNEQGLNMLLWLSTLRNVNLSGIITIMNDVIITYEQKYQLVKGFGDIDSDENSLRIIYKYTINNSLETIIFCDGVTDSIKETGTYQFKYLPLVAEQLQVYANYISKVEWILDENEYAIINQDGLMTVTSVGESAANPSANLMLRCTLINGSVLTDEIEIYFCYKEPELGDYVYADGTYTKVNRKGKTKIGIIFCKENGLVEFCTLSQVTSNDSWGLSGAVSGVTVNGTTSANDTPVPNKSGNHGIYTKDTDANYWNATTNTFVNFSPSVPLGDFAYTPSVSITITNLTGGDVTLMQDTVYSAGYYYTLLLMNWRNRVLSYAELPIPIETENESEQAALSRLMNAIQSSGGSTNYRQYYYPLVSRCYAYKPTVKSYESLNSKYSVHNWYLPTMAQLSRIIFYYTRNDVDNTNIHDVFKFAKAEGLINYAGVSHFSSANEYDAARVNAIRSNGQVMSSSSSAGWGKIVASNGQTHGCVACCTLKL